MTFAEYLERIRTDRELTKKQLSDLVGYSPGVITALTRGERLPTRVEAVRIGEALYPEAKASATWYFLYLAGYWPEHLIGLVEERVVRQVYRHVRAQALEDE